MARVDVDGLIKREILKAWDQANRVAELEFCNFLSHETGVRSMIIGELARVFRARAVSLQLRDDRLIYGEAFVHLKRLSGGGFEAERIDPRRVTIERDPDE